MAELKAGVVVVTKFCKPNSKQYKGYISYINRDEAKRNEYTEQYNLYQNYMGNPEKTMGLFTAEKDVLSKQEKKELKQLFQMAQDNGSLMWQTVISFDNRWLEEYGLYKDGIVDEKKLREITRNAVGKMLKSENLEHAAWSAAVHQNTDNIHVHIATVEPQPMREKKEYVQYQYRYENGKRIKEPVLGPDGTPVKKREYVGRFKQKSIEACKSSVANQIIEEKDYNVRINQIIRQTLIESKRNHPLVQDRELAEKFLSLYQKMPKENRSLWNYNSNKMAGLRPEIDALSRAYIEMYHPEDYKKLKDILNAQAKEYEKAYGQSRQNFEQNKIQDLYTRMGNAILKELKEYDNRQREWEKRTEKQKQTIRRTGRKIQAGVHHGIRQAYDMQKSVRSLQKSMKSEYETWKNIMEYEQMQEQNWQNYDTEL